MRKLSITLVIFILLLWTSRGHALEKSTHERINETIATYEINGFSLDSYLKNRLGIYDGVRKELKTTETKEIWVWIQKGGQNEDEPIYTRSRNHFHNPLLSWDEAGLNSLLFTGMSSALWIQDQTNRRVTDLGGDWSWKKARQFYYAALTGDSTELDGFVIDDGSYPVVITGTTNMAEAGRNKFLAWTFRALGQTMHLVQDASVPSHTRNDVHILRNYENWVEDLRSNGTTSFQDLLQNPKTFTGSVVSIASLIDTTQYRAENDPAATIALTYGLAEYTNANFFSEDTINLPGYGLSTIPFPYPNVGSTDLESILTSGSAPPETIIAEDGVPDTDMWVKKTGDGESFDHLAKFGYMTNELAKIQGNINTYSRSFILDDKCYEDYAKKLLPRAVGYSASLLNYFFRGTLEISLPDAGVYSIADGSKTPYDAAGCLHQRFSKIKAKVANTTANNEPIHAGKLTAVARYKIIPNYVPDLSNYSPDPLTMKSVPYSYSVSDEETVGDGDISSEASQDFTFTFSNYPIPAGITDLTLQVVFKGTIGNENADAVAVGMKDLMEPTHLTFWNLTDMHSIDYPGPGFSIYTFEELKSLAQQDSALLQSLDDSPGGYPDPLDNEEWLKGQFDQFTFYFKNDYEYHPTVTVDVPPGGHVRMIVLVDQPNVQFLWSDSLDSGGGPSVFAAAVDQADKDGKYAMLIPLESSRPVFSEDGQGNVPSVQHYYDGAYKCTMLHNSYCTYPIETADPVSPVGESFTSEFE